MANLIGRIINNRYQVLELLGRGGMAEVYKAWDKQRGVALAMKVLREDLAEDKVFLKRFQREADSLARLQHPNIIRFFGLEQEGRLAFILMDFIDGSTLRGEIFDAGQPLPISRILQVILPVCNALHYAHQHGLAHCDVKTANIMTDRHGKVYLTDFGIARMTDAATSTMVGAGTPAYMAPELVQGHDPTPQSDIYALGIVLYEMATGGERPFNGERAAATGTTAEKVRWEQINLPPIPPSRYNPRLLPALQQIILRSLHKDPQKRFSSALEMAVALEQSVQSSQLANTPAFQSRVYNSQPAKNRSFSSTNRRQTNRSSFSGNSIPAKSQQKKQVNILIIAGALSAFIIVGVFLLQMVKPGQKPDYPIKDETPSQASPATSDVIIAEPFQPMESLAEATRQPSQFTTPIGIDTIDQLTQIDTFTNLNYLADLLAFSPDKRLLAFGGIQTMALRHLDESGYVEHFTEETTANAVVFSPKGDLLAAGSGNGFVILWHVDDPELSNYFQVDSNVRAVAFSPDSEFLYAVTLYGTLYQWRISNADLIQAVEVSGGLVTDAEFSPDRKAVAFGINGGNIILARTSDGVILNEIEVYYNLHPPLPMVNGMAFSPDGASLAVSDSNFAGIRVWDIYSNKILYTLTDAQDLSHRFLSFSYDGSLLVSGTFSGSLYFWDCSSGSLEKSLTGHASDVMDIKFSPDGVLLASISEDNQIIIWGIP